VTRDMGLVLNRSLGQVVVITDRDGNRLTVTLVQLGLADCKLAFKGARDAFQVMRKEVQERIDGAS
jgi:sRNA-binding carbon storage regulator CsrA